MNRTTHTIIADAMDRMREASESLFRASRLVQSDSAAFRTLDTIRRELTILNSRLGIAPELGADISTGIEAT